MTGRHPGKVDRREGGERRADKRRVGDRSKANVRTLVERLNAKATAKSVWALDDALILARALWSPLQERGWHVGITGSVMYRGYSDKDLDIIAYPRNTETSKPEKLTAYLRSLGWRRRSTAEATREVWRERGITDAKSVEVWALPDGRRVDLMVMW